MHSWFSTGFLFFNKNVSRRRSGLGPKSGIAEEKSDAEAKSLHRKSNTYGHPSP
jgi:hypothetical protein